LAVLGILVLRVRPSTLPDEAGDHPMRIVSLAPSATEMLFALGEGDSIVAVTNHCDYPPEANRIERIGGFGSPNMEKLLALSPELVVTAGSERKEVVRALRSSGVRVLEVKIRNIYEMFEGLRQIGQAVGKPHRAEEVIAGMKDKLQTVAVRFSKTPSVSLPRVFVELWDDPLTTVGAGSFLDDVISRAGGVNVAHELSQPNPRVSAEKVIEWNPHVIVVVHMARGGNAAGQMAERIGWSDIAAVQEGKIVRDIPPDLILRPGPRLIDGVRALAERLHGAPPGTESVANGGTERCP
jgi:iron complex transport system substrate-binding protein